MSKKDIIKRKKGEVIYEAKLDDNEFKIDKLKMILGGVIIGMIIFIILFI